MLETLASHPTYFEAVLFSLSVAAGAVGSILGLGGGMILVPILTLVFKVKIQYAMGASIISVIATSSGASATFAKDHVTNIRLGMLLAIAATIGGWGGAMLSGFVQTKLLFLIFSVMLGLSGILMLWPNRNYYTAGPGDWLAVKLNLNGTYRDEGLNQDLHYSVSNVVVGFIMMWGVGLLTGLLGVGCGALRIPAMDKTMRLPIKVSSATSNFMIGITSAVSAVALFVEGHVLFFLAAPVALGVLLGSWMGSRWMMRLSNVFIRRMFLVILFIMSVEMSLRTLTLFGSRFGI